MAIITVLDIVAEATAIESSLKSRDHGDIKVISDSICKQAFTTRKRGNVFKIWRKKSQVFH